jgi:hypothetical protein
MGESIMFLIDDMHAVNWQHVSKSPQWVPEVEKIEPSMPTIGRFGEDFSLKARSVMASNPGSSSTSKRITSRSKKSNVQKREHLFCRVTRYGLGVHQNLGR